MPRKAKVPDPTEADERLLEDAQYAEVREHIDKIVESVGNMVHYSCHGMTPDSDEHFAALRLTVMTSVMRSFAEDDLEACKFIILRLQEAVAAKEAAAEAKSKRPSATPEPKI